MYLRKGSSLCCYELPRTGGGTGERNTAMSRFRSLISQSPAIVISVLAATLSLGGGAFASTHLVAGPSQGPIHTLQVAHSAGSAHNATSSLTAGVSWASLVLQNAWVSSNATFNTG